MAIPTDYTIEDMQSAEAINALAAAIRERYIAVAGGTLTDHVVPGQNVQSASVWAGLQTLLPAVTASYMRSTDVPGYWNATTNAINPAIYYTANEIYAAIGIPGGFTRKRPRIITSLAATQDEQGNAVANGQAAYLISYDSGQRINPAIYQHNGTQWLYAATTDTSQPDYLYTDRWTPRVIVTTSSSHDVFGHPAAAGQRALVRAVAAATPAYRGIFRRVAGSWVPAPPGVMPDVLILRGQCQPGDYLGPWLMSEAASYANAIGNITGNPSIEHLVTSTSRLRNVQGDEMDTIAAARASAEAAFSAASMADFASQIPAGVRDIQLQAWRRSGPTTRYRVFIRGQQSRTVMRISTAHVSKKVHVFSESYYIPKTAGDPEREIYDSQDYAFAEGEAGVRLHETFNVPAGTLNIGTLVTGEDITSPPPNYPSTDNWPNWPVNAPIGSGRAKYLGHFIRGRVFACCEWDFTV